jgi:hypothetical protein
MSAVRRAVLDPAVVAEWQRRCAEYKRKARPLWYVLAALLLLAVLPPLMNLVPPWPYYGVVAFIGLALTSHLRLRHQVILLCPHCGKTPVAPLARLPLYEIDCCSHCYHWLVNPRGGPRTSNQRWRGP